MTKPVPGAKRGRPPKPKPPKRPASRPPMPLRQHPEKYLIACQASMADAFGSYYQASKAIVALTYGLSLSRAGDGLLEISYPRFEGHHIDKTIDRHRKLTGWYLSRELETTDREWLIAISKAISLAVAGASFIGSLSRPDLAQREVLRLCASVNEMDLAHQILIPLIERGLPDDLGPEGALRLYADFLEAAYPPE